MNTKALAKKIRIHVLNMTSRGGSAHIGSALSITEILAVLDTGVLHVDAKTPAKPYRHRFMLSKGHAGLADLSRLA